MTYISRLSVVVLVGAIAASAALAESGQKPSTVKADAPAASSKATPAAKAEPSMVSKVDTWTLAVWNAAKAGWAKDKAKWAACRKDAGAKKLSGRKSWSFLYTCMT